MMSSLRIGSLDVGAIGIPAADLRSLDDVQVAGAVITSEVE